MSQVAGKKITEIEADDLSTISLLQIWGFK